ncbi:Holliday junction resolvase RecU [Paenibacillus medicaginis]|uniref:Holliday junction resolvase RecU n=1 Tax=Paenibacillus medicaginis TaxID=1470560 RepID=A0ABV5C0L3_9BACL
MSTYANRGMGFESLLDFSNQLYERNGVAVINKRPTPVKVTKSSGNRILAGYFERASTVDYDGSYRGRAIAFEAKSVKSLERFELKNLHEHQFDYLQRSEEVGGAIAFLLVEFTKHGTTFLLPVQTLRTYWREYQKPGGKVRSIPLADFEIYAYEVRKGRYPVDYLSTVDRIWFPAAEAK